MSVSTCRSAHKDVTPPQDLASDFQQGHEQAVLDMGSAQTLPLQEMQAELEAAGVPDPTAANGGGAAAAAAGEAATEAGAATGAPNAGAGAVGPSATVGAQPGQVGGTEQAQGGSEAVAMEE